jgi:hypothetical protein
MVIRESNNCIEIEAVDCVPSQLPAAGDRKLSVVVSSGGYGGQAFAWVAATSLADFLTQLRDLEQRRQGTAALEGLSPNDFRLRVWSVDRRGHLAIGGLIARHLLPTEGGPYRHALEFAFEFDPTLLPSVLISFQAMTESRA